MKRHTPPPVEPVAPVISSSWRVVHVGRSAPRHLARILGRVDQLYPVASVGGGSGEQLGQDADEP